MRDVVAEFKPFNPTRLHEELLAALGGLAVGVSSGASGITLHLTDEATDEDEATALAVLEAHDPLAVTAEQAAMLQFVAAWRGGALIGKTPAQIYQVLGAQINGWASLADAKADLRDWLPLIGAALWYLLRGELDL